MRFLRRLLLVSIACSGAAHGQATQLFERYAERVVQVRVLERASGSKSVIGSGFYVSAEGLVVTNYHVVSSLVFQPHDFTVELLDSGGKTVAAKVVDLDVVHDLALLEASGQPPSHFQLELIELARGERIYSLGNPHDVGFSILEGTHNGIISESLYEHVHFSGSLNGGVSGGPTLDSRGNVVGVNVSSYGNELSFLVPVKYARELVMRKHKPAEPASLLERVREGLLENEQRVSALLLAARPPATHAGPWQLPGRWLPQLKEWAGRSTDDDPLRRHKWTAWGAASEDAIFLSDGKYTGSISLSHTLFEPDGASATRLYRQAGRTFFSKEQERQRDDELSTFTTRWRCRDALIEQSGTRLKAIVCLRGYKKIEGLYDAVYRYLTLDEADRVVVGELALTGFSTRSVETIGRVFFGGIAWKP